MSVKIIPVDNEQCRLKSLKSSIKNQAKIYNNHILWYNKGECASFCAFAIYCAEEYKSGVPKPCRRGRSTHNKKLQER